VRHTTSLLHQHSPARWSIYSIGTDYLIKYLVTHSFLHQK
jgi:hypothetical protein